MPHELFASFYCIQPLTYSTNVNEKTIHWIAYDPRYLLQ